MQGVIGPEAGGHRHEWENAVVFVKQGDDMPTYVSLLNGDNYHIRHKSNIRFLGKSTLPPTLRLIHTPSRQVNAFLTRHTRQTRLPQALHPSAFSALCQQAGRPPREPQGHLDPRCAHRLGPLAGQPSPRAPDQGLQQCEQQGQAEA